MTNKMNIHTDLEGVTKAQLWEKWREFERVAAAALTKTEFGGMMKECKKHESIALRLSVGREGLAKLTAMTADCGIEREPLIKDMFYPDRCNLWMQQ